MREGVRAGLLGGGGAACEPLMWALERLGVPIPEWVAFAVLLVSAALLLGAGFAVTHPTSAGFPTVFEARIAFLTSTGNGKLPSRRAEGDRSR